MHKPVVLTPDTVSADDYPTFKWQRTTRPREPYRYEPVRISIGNLTTDEPPTPGTFYYLGSIGDHLIRLHPGDSVILVLFVHRFGLYELIEWTQERGLRAWDIIYSDYWTGRRIFTWTELDDAWTDEDTIRAFAVDQTALQVAYSAAQKEGPNEQGIQTILSLLSEQDAYRLQHTADPSTGVIVERPSDIFARAWIELVDTVTTRLLAPRTCPKCGNAFTPHRFDQDYCDRECREQFNDRKRNQNQRRKAYKNKHQQRQRGTITQAEYDTWHDEWLEDA